MEKSMVARTTDDSDKIAEQILDIFCEDFLIKRFEYVFDIEGKPTHKWQIVITFDEKGAHVYTVTFYHDRVLHHNVIGIVYLRRKELLAAHDILANHIHNFIVKAKENNV